MRRSGANAKGFTLIELMIVVAIVGALSSIAVPEFQRATLRTRIAERSTIMRAIAKGVEDIALASSRIPANSGANFAGPFNPDANPGTTKRGWMQAQPGWRDLPLIVEGATYCSYQFVLFAVLTPMVLQVQGDCDIDGDGVRNSMVHWYTGVGHAFVMQPAPLGEVVMNPESF